MTTSLIDLNCITTIIVITVIDMISNFFTIYLVELSMHLNAWKFDNEHTI